MTNATPGASAATDIPVRMVRRVIAFPLVLLVLGAGLVGVPGILLANTVALHLRGWMPGLLFPWAVLAVTITWLAYRAFKRWIERAPDRELPLDGNWVGESLVGLLVGAALFSGVVGAVSLLGGIRITGLGEGASLGAIAGMALTAAVNEEVLFRAIGFRFSERLGGSLFALVATSLLFGFAHFANAGATLFSSVAIATEAGIMLGAAFMLTRRLWFAVGIHAGWNFTQGWIWSIPVSGQTFGTGLFVTERQGPDWLSGGTFGLEASAVTMVITTLFGLAMLIPAVRRGHWVRAGWQTRPLSGSPPV